MLAVHKTPCQGFRPRRLREHCFRGQVTRSPWALFVFAGGRWGSALIPRLFIEDGEGGIEPFPTVGAEDEVMLPQGHTAVTVGAPEVATIHVDAYKQQRYANGCRKYIPHVGEQGS